MNATTPAGIFATAQPKYAALGIATFPFDATTEIKRGPLVENYQRMGLRASKEMAVRFPDAPGLAAMAGPRNRLTIIDIDERGAAGERLLADVQRQFGNAKVISRTGSGGFHAYYLHSGESRKIRPDSSKPIDLIGGGPIVLPPTLGFRCRYEIIHGRVEDLAALEPIRAISASAPADVGSGFADMRANSGRNDALFHAMCKEARQLPQTVEAFEARAMELNHMFGEPMVESRVINTARSVFKYVETGQLRTGEHGAWFRRPQAQELARDPFLFALLAWLKAENGPDAEFMVADGLAAPEYLDWPRERLQMARRRAMADGWIVRIRKPYPGVAALYRWGPTAYVQRIRDSVGYPQ
jgi:hypothetical protein